MPYKKRAELPKGVRHVLPEHAQDIYKEAFNNAWKQYHQNEERAHRVAWSAVKKEYHKGVGEKWKKK